VNEVPEVVCGSGSNMLEWMLKVDVFATVFKEYKNGRIYLHSL